MYLWIFMAGLVLLCAGIQYCLFRPSAHDLEQAALLPFADDPDAARRMSEATGLHCEQVITPLPETLDAPANYRLDA